MKAFTDEASCQLVSKTHTSDVDAESAQLAPSGAAGTGGESDEPTSFIGCACAPHVHTMAK